MKKIANIWEYRVGINGEHDQIEIIRPDNKHIYCIRFNQDIWTTAQTGVYLCFRLSFAFSQY